MKYIFLLLCLIVFFYSEQLTFGAVSTLYVSSFFNPEIVKIENLFRTILPCNNSKVIYTKVPRGLIVSIDQSVMFEHGQTKIKDSGYCVLDAVIKVLKTYNNRCVIESHSDEKFSKNSIYKEDWEITITRANNVADYIIKKGQFTRDRIFPLGFGEFMPFHETVSKSAFMDNRIDFVIIDYDFKR